MSAYLFAKVCHLTFIPNTFPFKETFSIQKRIYSVINNEKFIYHFHPSSMPRVNGQTQEARRVLLSDINFTSMVPELSRSADHLCQAENADPNSAAAAAAAAADGDASTATPANSAYYKGVTHLQTPDYKGPSATSGTPTKG